MQLTKHIGCLLALVFATAPAFAADWFTADLGAVSETAAAPWSAAPAGWTYAENVASFNDWDAGLVYTAATAVTTSSSNSIIKTTIKFTALDKADFFVNDAPQAVPSDAKAGLTIVEDSDVSPVTQKFYGIVNGVWTELTGDPAGALAAPVEVKVEITKGVDANYVKYTVGTQVLGIPNSSDPLVAKTDAFAIQSVTYMGCVPALSSLVAFAYGNTAEAKESVVIAEPATGVPPTINYNPADLADRGVDVTSAVAVKGYLTASQSNGQLGWVNTTLGIDDTQTVAVVSSEYAKDSVTADFGFVPDGNSTIQYVVNGGSAADKAVIATGTTGISNVKVQVTQAETTVDVATVEVGVMNTGKEVTDAQKTAHAKVFDIIAVPFNAFSGDITVANLLDTAELTDGDTLHIPSDSGYNVWSWNATAGEWQAPTGAKKYGALLGAAAATADQEILTQGEAIWLEHDANSKIVIAGTPGTTEKPLATGYEVKAGSKAEPNWELVANPSIKPIAISTIEGNNGDQIVIEDAADPRQYERKDDAWGKYVKTTTEITIPGTSITVPSTKLEWTAVESTEVIGAGIGFWYVNTGAAVTIDFPNNK